MLMESGGEVAAKAISDACGTKGAAASCGKAAEKTRRTEHPRKKATTSVEGDGWVGHVKKIT